MNEHASAFLTMLAGIDTIYDFRCIHDKDKAANARPLRGTFAQCEQQLTAWQAEGFAPHVMINATDGNTIVNNKLFSGKLAVVECRAQLLDCDGPMAAANAARALAWQPAAHVVVDTSPGHAHLWWMTTTHRDKQLFEDNQRRLSAAFGGDPQFIDVAHTARLPGFWNMKREQPHFVTVRAGPAWGNPRIDPWLIAAPLMHIDIKAGASDRKPLGTPSMAAPSWDWLVYALQRIDPNALGFMEWIAITASFKQAGWQFGEATIKQLWEWWCAQYRRNDAGENLKQWNAINETASGWKALVRAARIEGDLIAAGLPAVNVAQPASATAAVSSARVDVPAAMPTGFMLSPAEQADYFKGCFWVDQNEKILTPSGRFMGSTGFNGKYGGKLFVLDNLGSKLTDEPWKAALRGTVFNVPKVDHERFLPAMPFGTIVDDEFGRKGVNVYKPPVARLEAGDISPFLQHVERVLPNESDRAILYAFLAQCVQRPGIKVRWSVLIQSMEGAGKTIFKAVLERALGQTYLHSPNATELTEGGGKFNGWLRNKLMICVDEIRTDEKLNLIEVLKPMITDMRIEMQNKGADQVMQDNPSNWLMFTNYKDAIPARMNDRRYCIMYSQIQDLPDLERLGMDGRYYSALNQWVNGDGAMHVAHWLMNYTIPRELDAQLDCTRAPRASMYNEVIAASRSVIEQLIVEAVDSGLQGFRNGWVSTVALNVLMKDTGHRATGPRSVSNALKNLGYVNIGKATKPYLQEKLPFQATLYNRKIAVNISQFARDQGYE